MEFRNFGFLREVKIFLMSVVGLSYEGVGEGGYIYLAEVSSFYVHFPILKCKILKIQSFLLSPHFQYTYFHIKIYAALQVDIEFNTESKFSCPRSSFSSPSVGTQKQPSQWNCFLFYPFRGFWGLSKPFS